jgi:hypothetical protein
VLRRGELAGDAAWAAEAFGERSEFRTGLIRRSAAGARHASHGRCGWHDVMQGMPDA